MTREFTPSVSVSANYFRPALFASALLLGVLFALVRVATPRFSQGNEKFGIAFGLVLAAIGAASLLLGIFFSWPKLSPSLQVAAVSCVLPVLLAVSLSDKLLPSFFLFDPSGRSVARELRLHNIPAEKLAMTPINRGMKYSLNFYMHMEIRNWDENYTTEDYILSRSRSCKRFAPPPFVCEEVPIDYESTGMYLYRVRSISSADRLHESRQPH
jgi:hypothetical protein